MTFAPKPNDPNGTRGPSVTSNAATQQARVKELIKSMDSQTKKIDSETKKLNMASLDAASCRPRVKEAEKVFKSNAEEAAVLFTSMPDSLQKQKLGESVEQCQVALRKALADFEAREQVLVAESPVHSTTSSFAEMKQPYFTGHPSENDRQQPLLGANHVEVTSLQQVVVERPVSDAELQIHTAVVSETVDQVAVIARETRILNEVMSEVADLTVDQSDVIDSIANHVTNIVDNTGDAIPELEEANRRHSRQNKRTWILLLIAVILAALLIAVLASQ